MENSILNSTTRSGCDAKIDSSLLHNILNPKSFYRDKNVLIGSENGDDAGVYRLSDDLAIVQTVDFFPPMVDDPFTFGKIAACNSLSDIYAMGAVPITALNIVAFPTDRYPIESLKLILEGGNEILKEAKTSLLGGHSIQDDSIKYGLSVTGTINPNKIASNDGAESGDILVLTKPLGIGVAMNLAKGDDSLWNTKKTVQEAIKWMSTLNSVAGEAISKFNIKSATDITGFSFIGHLSEIANASKKDVKVYKDSIPFIYQTDKWAKMGFYPKASYKNREIYSKYISTEYKNDSIVDLLFDSQTSGGVLLAIPKKILKDVLIFFDDKLDYSVSIVGEITPREGDSLKIEIL
ncbi:selenide, water dikinase SelD [bacterium]|nr:selenide, water dikinase SelD [bacterium]